MAAKKKSETKVKKSDGRVKPPIKVKPPVKPRIGGVVGGLV